MENGIVVPIKAKTVGFESEIAKAESRLKKFENAIDAVNKTVGNKWNQMAAGVAVYTTALKNVVGAIQTHIISPLASAVNGFVEFGDQLAKTSQRVGIGVESLGGLKFAAEQCGANFDVLTDALKTFQNQIGAAQSGDSGMIEKLRRVGVDAEAFKGLNNEEQLMKLADHIQAIGNQSEQTRVAMELFGDAGFKLLPFFQEGSSGIKKLMEEGRNVGAVLGEHAASGAAALGDSMNRMRTSARNASVVFVSTLAPAMTTFFDSLSSVITTVMYFKDEIFAAGVAVGLFAGSLAVLSFVEIVKGLYATVSATKALSFALTAISAHPVLAAFTVLVGTLAMVSAAFETNTDSMYRLNDEMKKNCDQVQKLTAEDEKLMERLKELQSIEDPLKNSEMEEANQIIEKLSSRYNGLGVSVDKATGKIVGLVEAQKKLDEKIAEDRAEALDKWIEEAKENKKRLTAHADHLKTRWSRMNSDWRFLDYIRGGKERDAEKEGNLRQEASDLELKIAEAEAERDRLRGVSGAGSQDSEKPLEALTEENRKAREEEAKTKEDAAKIRLDTDLMDPLEKAYAELAEKTAEKYAKIEADIETARKANDSALVAALEAQLQKLPEWEAAQRQKISENEIARRDADALKEYDEWKKANPDIVAIGVEDGRISGAQSALETAKERHAQEVLGGDAGRIAEAENSLKEAEIELAKVVAAASGEDRRKAREEVAALKKQYEEKEKEGAGTAELNALAEKILAAEESFRAKSAEYFAAIGTLQAAQPVEEQVAEAAEAVSFGSRGTFSAFGMDAVMGNSIPQQTLDEIKKILLVVGRIEEEKNGEGFVL
ncbi:MAG: hypothetical protein Q4D38_14120 [Planctomycetia bacterium]|nr:hypothetical protein [Planctomycetia bacterium]